MEDKKKLMQEYIGQLNAASDAYYNGRSELMSDYEWDAMFDALKKLEEETGIVLEESPTHKVSEDEIVGQKEEHEFSALSLAKTKKVEDLVKWAEGKPIWLSWKLDGLTLVVTYDDGKLSKVVTRGDGHRGTNITHLAPAITGILPKIEEKGHLVIRGEAVISYDDFEQFRMESEEDYANPRNLASGSLSLKDIEEVKRRKIHWLPFTLVYCEKEINSWGVRMAWLEELGFTCVERECITHPSQEEITKTIDAWTKRVTSRENPYPVDGLVISYDDVLYAQTGSITGHHATKAGYAFKWADESASTQLDYVEWSCAASTITPVAVFEPVELEGTIVKRASLCNISECERLGIGGKGTQIEVIKANKIIPKVIKVTQTNGNFEIPGVCPVCQAPTRVQVSKESGTKTLRCTNEHCPAKQLKKFTRFVSKAGMDIDGISEMTLARFINEGWIKEYADIYRLKEHEEEIVQLEGFGEKSMQNIDASIEKARKVNAQKFLYALNIPLIGQDVAKRLLSSYTLVDLINTAKNADNEEVFAHIDGIGKEKSSTFVRFFQKEENVLMVENLLKQIQVEEVDVAPSSNRLENLVFVVTGDVHHYQNRNELKAYIEDNGGKVTGSVSKSTSYLINNDVTSASSKNQKAKELNIPIISEDEFIERFAS
ncbi:MAG: NAD-dependent DNA ligase LigA [Solobacterium sp.]|nr:NAD-dependent DNA ligase LigA [Solobacterium sp.]